MEFIRRKGGFTEVPTRATRRKMNEPSPTSTSARLIILVLKLFQPYFFYCLLPKEGKERKGFAEVLAEVYSGMKKMKHPANIYYRLGYFHFSRQ
jgi:hypothetical protein